MKKFILLILCIIFLNNIYNVYKFRNKPNHIYFREQFGITSSVLNYFNRYLILLNGGKLYNDELEYYFKEIPLREDSNNKKALMNIVSKKSNESFFKNIFVYPFQDALEEEIGKRLNNSHNCALLDYNYFTLEWIFTFDDDRIKNDTIEVMDDFESIFSYKILGSYDNHLATNLSKCAYTIYNNIDEVNKNIRETNSEAKKSKILHNIFSYLQTNTGKSYSFLVNKLVQKEKIPFQFIVKYLDSKNTAEKIIINKYLLDNLKSYTGTELGIICLSLNKQSVAEDLFSAIAKIDEIKATHIFHALVKRDLVAAEETAKAYIKRKDSIIRKGIIGILVLHKSHLGQKYIEDLFIGSARRIVGLNYKFYQHTNAIEEYKRISRHDYLEVGKEFPPIYCVKPLEDEIKQWKDFIRKYPLFPATDDAYYRLIYKLVYDNNIAEAQYYIDKYFELNFPDTDATEMILRIKKLLALGKTTKEYFYTKIKNCEIRSFIE